MTEATWLAAADPGPMLAYLSPASGRKRRLLACASCRRNWKHLRDARCTTAVETAERAADGLASADDLGRANAAVAVAYALIWSDASEQRWWYVRERAVAAVLGSSDALLNDPSFLSVLNNSCDCSVFASDDGTGVTPEAERRAQTALVRDVFGNPFRPAAFDAAWKTDTAVSLARQMYERREFSAMPILADALQDAGCDDEELLAHCRDAGPHVRGCWVVDLVLGKE